MKVENTVKKMLVVLMMICVVLCTTACSASLNGTYTSKDEIVEQSFTFKKGNKVEVSAFGLYIEGDYEIDEDQITITYSIFDIGYKWKASFSKEKDSIFVDGVEFVKEK